MEETRGVECFVSEVKQHPQCIHGPTLLFGRHIDGKLEKFFTCSACRDRKLCRFYLKYGDRLTKSQHDQWEEEIKKNSLRYNHRKLYIRFNELLAGSEVRRAYCHDCEKLLNASDKDKHQNHRITMGLTDYQMRHPTEILKPLDDSKKEAQYLFSKKSTIDIANMLLKLKAKQLLCIGTPRIHEYIMEHFELQVTSLLLDIDGRFHNFFGPLHYCWYNLFNHHFFNKEAEHVFKDFMTHENGKDMYLVCDPPFGGRVEAMSQTIKTICELHKRWNNIENNDDSLKIMFIFPYFMEAILREKSDPPGSGGLNDLKITDYKVDYDNHPLFISGEKGRKFGSPVRIFTNILPKLLEFPQSDGYKYCKKCEKWVSVENKHCKKCKACTSKNGTTYQHCGKCNRCVKPTWKHCDDCQRCHQPSHTCGQKPIIRGRCFKCNEYGHTGKNCMSDDNTTHRNEEIECSKMDVNSEAPTSKKLKVNEKLHNKNRIVVSTEGAEVTESAEPVSRSCTKSKEIKHSVVFKKRQKSKLKSVKLFKNAKTSQKLMKSS